MATVEVAGAYPPPKKVCHVSGRENKKESNGSLLPASEETHRGDQPTSLCFTAFSRGEAPDKLHRKSDYDPEVCPDSSQLNSTCPMGHNMKIYNLLTGLLVSFPIWPHLPWIQSPKWPCKTEIRPGLSPLRMIRVTHITHSTNKPQTYQPGGERGWCLPTGKTRGAREDRQPLRWPLRQPPCHPQHQEKVLEETLGKSEGGRAAPMGASVPANDQDYDSKVPSEARAPDHRCLGHQLLLSRTNQGHLKKL